MEALTYAPLIQAALKKQGEIPRSCVLVVRLKLHPDKEPEVKVDTEGVWFRVQ